MLEQTARVIESSSAGVWVEAVEPSGCGTCGGQGCSTRRLAELLQRRPRRFRVDSALDLTAGERVVIGIAEGSVLRAALRGYGVPLLLMLAGALLAEWFWPGDLSAVAGMLLGGLAGWAGLRGSSTALPVVMRKETTDGIWLSKGV
jgi:sigma-E factor negative regulatory protein RseC